MDVETVRKFKKQLQDEIEAAIMPLVNTFRENTGLSVVAVDLDFMEATTIEAEIGLTSRVLFVGANVKVEEI